MTILRRSRRSSLSAFLLAAVSMLAATVSFAQAPDSNRFRFEAGASGDFTNERFYETFDDTSFRRNAVDSPERRYAGVLLAGFDGARNGGVTSFQLLNELSL